MSDDAADRASRTKLMKSLIRELAHGAIIIWQSSHQFKSRVTSYVSVVYRHVKTEDWSEVQDNTDKDIPFNPGTKDLVIKEEPIKDGPLQRDVMLSAKGDFGLYDEINLSINWLVEF